MADRGQDVSMHGPCRRSRGEKSGVAGTARGRWAQGRFGLAGHEKANAVRQHLCAGHGLDGHGACGQRCFRAGVHVIAGSTKVRAIRIALEIHHIGLFDRVAVVPDPGIVMTVVSAPFLVVIGHKRAVTARVIAMVGVFDRAMPMNAGDGEIMRLIVIELDRRPLWRLAFQRVRQRHVVMRRRHDRRHAKRHPVQWQQDDHQRGQHAHRRARRKSTQASGAGAGAFH